MRNIQKTDEKEVPSCKDAIRSKEPLVEGRFKRFMRKAALALAISLAPATLTVVATSNVNCQNNVIQNVPRPDAEVEEDAEVRDADADPPDADPPDARVDANSPDSSVVDAGYDAALEDSGVDAAVDSTVQEDSSVVDAEVPDSSLPDSAVPDAEVDAGPPPVCTGVFTQTNNNWLLNYALPAPIGGYNIEYATYVDPTNITINVYCAATLDLILANEQFTAGVQKTVYLASGDMNLRMTVTVFDINMALVNAAIELP